MLEGQTERDESLKLTKAEEGEGTEGEGTDAVVVATKVLKAVDTAGEVVVADAVETPRSNAKTVRTLP